MPPRRAEADGLSALERRIYSTVHAAPEHTLTGDDLATRMGDVPIEEQLLAINSLLKKSLFNAQKGPSGIQYVAISRDEASLLGSMDANELIIYNHIKEAKNDGIWTKVIKARTNLHQTIMTRCLKLLEQKQLVKAVKSVKFPTRKIYMLYDLVPSIELSGGPWYTDNELDTGFIHELSMACLRYIQSKTWPKDGRSSSLYPASHTVQLPTAANVHQYLRSAKLTDTELEPEHVVALLDLLIYNNEVEKIPALPSAPSAPRRPLGASDDESSNDSEPISHPAADRHSRRKRRRVSIVASSDEQQRGRARAAARLACRRRLRLLRRRATDAHPAHTDRHPGRGAPEPDPRPLCLPCRQEHAAATGERRAARRGAAEPRLVPGVRAARAARRACSITYIPITYPGIQPKKM